MYSKELWRAHWTINHDHQSSPDASIAFNQIDRRETAIVVATNAPKTIVNNKVVFSNPLDAEL